MASVPGFLTKTFEIFSNPEYSDCCGWGPNGETIVIRKVLYICMLPFFDFLLRTTLICIDNLIYRSRLFRKMYFQTILNILIFNLLFVN